VDVHLPGANGLWLADQIRESSPVTAIILATGDQRVPPAESLRPHVLAYLVKPISKQSLIEVVEAGVQWSAGQRRNRETKVDQSTSKSESDIPVVETCPTCASVGGVVMTPFRWGDKHLVNWRCTTCRHVWVTPDRRTAPRE